MKSAALALLLATFAVGCAAEAPAPDSDSTEEEVSAADRRVIVFVWDGLRPDSINATDTPNLLALENAGVKFTDNHSTFPTFTMMNSSSFATGAFPEKVGFYGNSLWQPGPAGSDSGGHPFDFQQPVFTEDYGLLNALNAYYKNELLMVGTLFEAAQKAGKKTAAIGKSGAAFLQDYKRGGLILDEKHAWPLSFAQELQAQGLALPKTSPLAYQPNDLVLAATNGDPTAQLPKKALADGVSSDPTDAAGAPPNASNAYMMDVYLRYVLPTKDPDLSVVWFRNPDSTQHTYGPGSPNAHDALKSQDALLGQLRTRLAELGRDKKTDIIVVSDHGHSSVAGDKTTFPLRAIAGGVVGAPDANGWSASGEVRIADLLTRAGFTAYDGAGCEYEPSMNGTKADGTTVYPVNVDTTGTICGTAGAKYTTPSYKVPATLPPNAVVIAANGGSDYIYVPSHDAKLVADVTRFLQGRAEYGAIFVDPKYDLAGTMSMDAIHVANAAGRNPDIIASFSFDANAVVAGMPGTEYSSMQGFNNRGMHGTFSPRDVHNTLIAFGPDFRKKWVDPLPTGNVDVAPTIARLLRVELPQAQGRPLLEAMLHGGVNDKSYSMFGDVAWSNDAATGLKVCLPTSPDCDEDKTRSTYFIELHSKTLYLGQKSYTYFDTAKAVRQ
jgi:arylsulfatase A-like enzyme